MLTTDDAKELAYRYPWLYHVVKRSDAAARETVASDGLVSGHSRRYWHPLWRPRSGHVYLATHGYLATRTFNLWCEGDELYAVATKHLVPARVNPDEDHFSGRWNETACDQFRLLRPPGQNLWDTFGESVVPSFGDWADQVDLGSDPATTVHSLKGGSVAYNGVVPPTALQRWDAVKEAWVGLAEATVDA